jgi:hypothetical protein
MTLSTRLLVAKSLEKHGRIAMNNTYANVVNGLVRFTGKQEDVQKELTLPNGTVLENPMTWDTFTHIYLLNK